MKEQLGRVLSAKFGLIIIMFLMPFINVSCSGMNNMTLSGMDLATGTTIQTKDAFSGEVKEKQLGAEPLATIALGMAILGMLVGFTKGKAARIANAMLGTAGVFFLIMLKGRINNEIMVQGSGMVSVTYETGFWLALLLFALTVAVSIYAALPSPKTQPEDIKGVDQQDDR